MEVVALCGGLRWRTGVRMRHDWEEKEKEGQVESVEKMKVAGGGRDKG